MITVVTKLMVFVLMFSICIVLKYMGDFGISLWKEEKFEKKGWEYIILGCAISYIFMIIFTGLI